MDKHYYFISQLPMLFFGQSAEINCGTFLEEAAKWLNPSEFNLISRISLAGGIIHKKDPRMLKLYKLTERRFRDELIQWRKTGGIDVKPVTFPLSLVKEGNPLEVERNLLSFRWKFIEELEWGHHFDLEFLICYYLKLQILDQLAVYDKETGLGIFRKVIEDQSRLEYRIEDETSD